MTSGEKARIQEEPSSRAEREPLPQLPEGARALHNPSRGDVLTEGPARASRGEDMLVRRVPRAAAQQFRAAAGARGLTHAQYLDALVQLHAAMRRLAEDDDEVAAELDNLGLTTVVV